MAVTLTGSEVSYTGNGVTVAFPTTFKFLKNSHLAVSITPAGGGTPVVQTLDVDYTVTGAGLDAGGTVTFLAAPALNETVDIQRSTPMTQETSFTTQGTFAPKVHEEVMDKTVMMVQDMDRRLDLLEGSGLPVNATPGNGLSAAGDVWNVGAGPGIVSNADDIEVDFGAAPTAVDTAAAAAGVADTVSRSDHKHNITTAAPGAITIGAAAAEGVAAGLARADHTHSLAAPAAPAAVNAAAADAGVAAGPARADHKHDIDTAVPVDIGTANSEGVSNSVARADHVHDHGAQTDGSLHAEATGATAGFMSAADKTKLDGVAAEFTGSLNWTVDAGSSGAYQTVEALEPTNESVFVVETLVAINANGGAEGAGYHLVGTFRKDAGTVTQIGATTVLGSHESAAPYDARFLVAAGFVFIQITSTNLGAVIIAKCRGRLLEAV